MFRFVMRAGLVASFGLGLSCAGPNLWTDLSSVSTGRTAKGRLRSPSRLTNRGRGWKVPERWKRRGFQYGTDELVAAVERAGRVVRSRHRLATLGVADLSRGRGGKSAWHRSHQTGRDVDLLFYTKSEKGRPMQPPENSMIRFDKEGRPFDPDGKGYPDTDWAERRFDAKRNWQLVEALLTDPSIRVQWIFVSKELKKLMLRYARRAKRPRWLVAYGRVVLRQPGDSRPHDNHMHVRVYCSRTDRFHGCVDGGPVWQHEKKTFKYSGPEYYDPVLWRALMSTTRHLSL